MKEKIAKIYRQVEEGYSSDEISRLISEFENLMEDRLAEEQAEIEGEASAQAEAQAQAEAEWVDFLNEQAQYQHEQRGGPDGG